MHLVVNDPRIMAQHQLKTLMIAVARHDRAAFKELYEATSAKLFAVAVRILKRADLAEEVLQDAYLKIWNQASDYSPGHGSPVSWMVAIVRNRAIDVLRKRSERPLADGDQVEAGLVDDMPDPFALAVQSEELRGLMVAMEALDPEHRKCVLLAYYHGYTHEEIAVLTKAPVGTVKSRIRRSLVHIRERMPHA